MSELSNPNGAAAESGACFVIENNTKGPASQLFNPSPVDQSVYDGSTWG